MPRGKNYVNNNKGLALQAGKKSGVSQLCEYGMGCTRPDCIYKHEAGGKSDNVCLPFLAGKCTFGKGCRRRHPGKQETEKLLARYRRTRCRHGDACHTDGCLYMHPKDTLANEPAYAQPDSAAFPPLNGAVAPAAAPKLPANSAWKSAPPASMQAAPSSNAPSSEVNQPVSAQYEQDPMQQYQQSMMYPPQAQEGYGMMPQWGGAGPYYPDQQQAATMMGDDAGYNSYYYPDPSGAQSPTSFNVHAKEFSPSGAF
jgi:hypothetical protein